MVDELKILTVEEFQTFLSKTPLYNKLRRQIPDFVSHVEPKVAFVHCPTCRAERPFRHQTTPRSSFPTPLFSYLRKTGLPGGGGVHAEMSGIYEFHFLCSGCAKVEFYCWVDINYEEQWLRKVGQSLPWSINISSELEDDLGNDADIYKKALTLMSQSYGIGACAYLRRMVENQINPLLQLLYDMRQIDGATSAELQQISDAIKNKNFTPKVDTASALLPQSIMVAGENPIKLIHDQLSLSIHALTEGEAMDIAIKVRAALEYLIIELNRQQKSKKQFIESIRAIKPK